MTTYYHVTASTNRASIEQHGLDWHHMQTEGIAGSWTPEVEGIYLARNKSEADWFVRFALDRFTVDVWAVENVSDDELIDNGSGLYYVERAIDRADLRLDRRDVVPPRPVRQHNSAVYSSRLTITYDD